MKLITQATLAKWITDGRAEMISDVTRAGYVDLRMCNGSRRTVQVAEAREGVMNDNQTALAGAECDALCSTTGQLRMTLAGKVFEITCVRTRRGVPSLRFKMDGRRIARFAAYEMLAAPVVGDPQWSSAEVSADLVRIPQQSESL